MKEAFLPVFLIVQETLLLYNINEEINNLKEFPNMTCNFFYDNLYL